MSLFFGLAVVDATGVVVRGAVALDFSGSPAIAGAGDVAADVVATCAVGTFAGARGVSIFLGLVVDVVIDGVMMSSRPPYEAGAVGLEAGSVTDGCEAVDADVCVVTVPWFLFTARSGVAADGCDDAGDAVGG